MEHLLNQNELAHAGDRFTKLSWLGFDHDTKATHPPATSLDAYAKMRGWTDHQLDALKSHPYLFGTTGLAMLQSMLFFGLWESLTGKQMPSGKFIHSSDVELSLSCAPLRGYIQRVSTLLCHDGRFPSGVTFIKTVTDQLTRVMQDVLSWDSILVAPHHHQFSQEISTLRRLAALAVDVLDLFNHLPTMSETHITGFHHLRRNSDFHVERLKKHGICPSYCDYLDFVSISAVEYFTVAYPFIDPSNKSHHGCNESACVRDNANPLPEAVNHFKSGSVSILKLNFKFLGKVEL